MSEQRAVVAFVADPVSKRCVALKMSERALGKVRLAALKRAPLGMRLPLDGGGLRDPTGVLGILIDALRDVRDMGPRCMIHAGDGVCVAVHYTSLALLGDGEVITAAPCFFAEFWPRVT